jgi:AsmA-like protein
MLLGIMLLLGLLLVRPGAQRLRGRIAGSISSAVGRNVEIGSVSVHLLPQPGFDLENFVVHDDPSFSAEPVLRSDDVTAALRVSSLFRGRLEIARLTLSEPSINLVRNSSGHWNLETVLERAARTPIAPTGKAPNENRPEFPYIEATHGRINFKFGAEKKAYALTNSTFNLWQDSENAWGMRLKAEPVRTDFNLSDTGLLVVDGTWQRAETLRQTPVRFMLAWDQGQLGQLTKLILGNDKGWRGTVKWSASLTGTPGDLGVHTEVSIADFRRFDILSDGNLRLSAKCDSRYSTAERTFSDILCHAPVGTGLIALNGTLGVIPGSVSYHMALTAQDIPAQAVAALLRRTKRDIPDDLTSTGKVDAIVSFERDGGEFTWSGGGQALGLRLASQAANTTVSVDSIPFAFSSEAPVFLGARAAKPSRRITAQSLPPNRVDIGPFDLSLGKPTPVLTQGWVSHSGYELRLAGDAQIQNLLRLARLVGIPAPRPTAEGTAKVDLQIAGEFSGFAAPRSTGHAQLQTVSAAVRGLNAPLEIASANVILSSDQIAVQNLSASVGESSWRGSLNMPRPCAVPHNCFVHFDLHADRLSTDQLNQWFNPNARKRPWYRFLTPDSQAGPSLLAKIHASGRLGADRLLIRNLLATKVSANVTLENGRLVASDLRGDLLGGKHTGEWKADFLARPPLYSGSGKVDHLMLGQLSETMHDGWITGTATASYDAKTSGLSAADLFSSTDATLEVEARDGTLPHIELSDQSGPLHLHHLIARLVLHDSMFEIRDGKLETPDATYQLSGTASLKQTLDLKLIRSGAPGFTITGTLDRPRVSPTVAQEAEAALKP